MKSRIFNLLILAFLLGGCGEQGPDVKLLYGTWKWVVSTGGLLPDRTPENLGYDVIVEIDNSGNYSVVENGQIIESINYTIEKSKEKGIDYLLLDSANPMNNKQVRFEGGDTPRIIITYYGGMLHSCADCEISTFEKMMLSEK